MRKEEQNFVEIEDDAVGQLLGGLKRVEAPGDFDFHVKARIAKGRPAARNASLIPSWLRVAVPLVLILFVGGYFGFRLIYSPAANTEPVARVDTVRQPDIAPVIEMPVQTEIVTASTNKELTAQIGMKPTNASEKTAVVMPEKLVSKTGSTNQNRGGGFRDESVGPGTVLRPKGIDSHRILPKQIVGSSGLAAQDMLTQLGINATYSEASWKIGVVTQNSIAERSGLKAGDVIEAINDQNLSEKTTLAMPFSGKNIRVRRDGKIMQIDLKR